MGAPDDGDVSSGGDREEPFAEGQAAQAAGGATSRRCGPDAAGEKFIGNVLPKHSKLVKALMRVLDAREKQSLSRICRKLREGDVLKFVSEITHEDVEDED